MLEALDQGYDVVFDSRSDDHHALSVASFVRLLLNNRPPPSLIALVPSRTVSARPLAKFVFGKPIKFRGHAGVVDSVPLVMPRPIINKRNQTLRLSKRTQDCINHGEVCFFGVPSQVVDLS